MVVADFLSRSPGRGKGVGSARCSPGGSHGQSRETVSNSIRVLVAKNKACTMLIVRCVGPVISHFSLAASGQNFPLTSSYFVFVE